MCELLQKDPPAVEPEIAVVEAEIAEPAAGRLLVERAAGLAGRAGRHAIQIRIVQIPEPRMLDLSAPFRPAYRRAAARARAWTTSSVSPLAAGATVNSSCVSDRASCRRCARWPGRGSRPSSGRAGRTDPRRGPRARRAARPNRRCRRGCSRCPGVYGMSLVAVRRLAQHDAVDRLVASGLSTRTASRFGRAGLDRVGHVEHERRSSPPSCSPTRTPLSQTSAM